MRTLRTLLAATVLVIGVAGCTQATAPTPTPAPSEPSVSATGPSEPAQAAPTGQAVWTADLANKTYQTWEKAPGYDTMQPAKGPHGKQVQIFVSDQVATTLKGTGATKWPTGSKIVKDAFDAGGAPVAVEYMQRTDQGWFYASYDTTGKILKEGVEVAPCAPCHKSGSDSVKSFKLP